MYSRTSVACKLGDRGQEKRLKQHSPKIQQIAAKLVETDLTQPTEISALIEWLEANQLFLFHNTQTQYLRGGLSALSHRVYSIKPLLHLNRIDYVGTAERSKEFFILLSFRLGFTVSNDVVIRENTNSNTYGLDIQNTEVREALDPLIEWDQVIYQHARERFIDDLHRALAELEKSKGPHFSSLKATLDL